MESSFETVIGAAAALCTTASYIPQLRKCWTTGETGDLSLKMLLLASGLLLWMVYGLMRGDAVIILANGVSLALLGCISTSKCGRVACPDAGRKLSLPPFLVRASEM